MSDDPFGRRDDERTDAFGRPVDEEREGALWSGSRPKEEGEAAEPQPERPAFLPPTDAPPDTTAWWAEQGTAPAPPSGPSGVARTTAPAGAEPVPGDLAGYAERAGAAVIDFFVRLAIAAVVAVIFAVIGSGDEDAITAGALIGIYVVAPFYGPLAMTRWNGQTIGHRAVDTRIVTRTGAPVTGGKAVVREVLAKHVAIEAIGGLLSFGILGLLNYLWPLWDKRNEALHDKMCDTRVVKA